MKSRICLLLAILFCSTGIIELNAQERSTQSPEVRSFFLNPDLKGAGQNSVNLYSGDVNLPINLLSLSGRGGLSTNVSAVYNSNIQNQRDVWALEAPTSILGLGWSMDYDKIVVDHKNTGNVHDDDFYLVSGGISNELVMTSSAGGTKTFEAKNYQFWKITYYKSDERWEIIKEDGMTYVFGGGLSTIPWDNTSDGNSIQWGVKWGNWIGSSMRTLNQSQHAIAWNLSKVKNTWGDEITYDYLVVEEEVGRHGVPDAVNPKKHTKASYLQTITNPNGEQIQFVYQNKLQDEYTDPHQELKTPYNPFAIISGNENLDIGQTGSWNATLAGGGTAPYTYKWEHAYSEFPREVNPNWEPDPASFGSSTSYSLTYNEINQVELNIRLTIKDANGLTFEDIFTVQLEENTSIDPGNDEDLCATDCDISPQISSIPTFTVDSHYEPDAYQEKYETKYLSRINVVNSSDLLLYYLDFNYGMFGTAGDPDYKRLLHSITQVYPNGEELPDLKFKYYNSSDVHPMSLEKVTYPTGAEVTYTYSELELAHSNRDVTISTPLGYEDPRVFIASNYVVMTYRSGSNLKVKVLTWDGRWLDEFEPTQTFSYGGEIVDLKQNFEVFTHDKYFIIIEGYHKEDTKRITWFYKDSEKTGDWISSTVPVFASLSKSSVDVVAGDDFFVILDNETGYTKRYTWDGETFQDDTINSINTTNNNDFFIGGTNNYYIHDDEVAVGKDVLQLSYLDELKNWQLKTTWLTSLTKFQSNISNIVDKNVITANGSLIAIKSKEDDADADNLYVYNLLEDYGITSGVNVGKHNDYDPVLIDGALIAFTQRSGSAPLFRRFDGVEFDILGVPATVYTPEIYSSIGNDLVLVRDYDNDGVVRKYDPNSASQGSSAIISAPPGDGIFPGNSNFTYPYMGYRYITNDDKVYAIDFENDINLMGTLVQGTNRYAEYPSIRGGINYVGYETRHNSTQDIDAHIQFLKNGSFTGTVLNYPNQFIGFTRTSDNFAQRSDNFGADIFFTFNHGSLKDATEITLSKVVNYKASGKIKDYPITKVEVDNGYETNQIVFEYETSKATSDQSGSIAQYNKVVTKAGNPAEGRTEHYFFNGLTNTELSVSPASVSYPTDLSKTTAHLFLSKVSGSLYKTRVYDSITGGNMLSENTNYYRVYEKEINRVSGGTQIDKGYYVRLGSSENEVDGVLTSAGHGFTTATGLRYLSATKQYSIDGVEYDLENSVTRAWVKYPDLKNKNILSPIALSETKVNVTNTSQAVTTWKDWGGGKWAPHKTYIKESSSSVNFDFANWSGTGEPTNGWIKTGEIVTRNQYGIPIETIGGDGLSSSKIFGFDGTRVLANFSNAELSEVFFAGFDDGDEGVYDTQTWTETSGTWVQDPGAYLTFPGNGSTISSFRNPTALDHSNSILEFDAKLTTSTSATFFGFDFGLTSATPGASTPGLQLRVYGDGSVKLLNQNGGATIATGSISSSVKNWHHVRIITRSLQDVEVIINGKQVIKTTTTTPSSSTIYYGFSGNGNAAYFDNLRIYPNDGITTSTAYTSNYLDVSETSNAEGYRTRIIRDENQRAVETLSPDGLVVSGGSSVLSRQLTGTIFSTTKPNATYQVSYPSYNAIRNSGGEYGDIDDADYWDASGASAIERLKGEGYSGLYALKYDQQSGGELSQTLSKNEFLWQGKDYFVRFWIKTHGYVPSAPTVTVELAKSGSAVVEQGSIVLSNANWTLFEAELNTGGGEHFQWNDPDLLSKLVISSNIDMDFLIDDVYVGELEYEGESRPGYAVSFRNGSGQDIQNQAWNGTNYTVSHTEYDDLGRAIKGWRPYEYATGNKYDVSFATNAQSYYGTSGSVRLYSTSEYYADPLSRMKSLLPVGSGTEKIEYTYSSETVNNIVFSKTIITDLGNVQSVTYSDYSGQALRSVAAVGLTEQITSESIIDPVARTSENRPPNYFAPPTGSLDVDWVATSTSNFLGLNTSTTSPDAGTASAKYDKLGRLRFSQSAQQAVQGSVSFTSYDAFGRPILSGEGEATYNSLYGDINYAFESDNLNSISVSAYDESPSSAMFPWSLFSSQTGIIDQENTLKATTAEAYKTNGKSASSLDVNNTSISGSGGTLSAAGNIILGTSYSIEPNGNQSVESGSKVILEPGFHAKNGSNFTASISPGLDAGATNDEAWQAIYYSYDFEGRPAKKWILTQDKPGLRTEIAYQYNDAGQVIRQHTKVGTSQSLYHFYSYDALGRTTEVYTSTSSTRPATPMVTYSYDAEGKAESQTITGVSKATMTYDYDEQGRINEIIGGSFSYFQDFTYNDDGTINETNVSNNGAGYSYTYTYNALNQMIRADYVNGTENYDLDTVSYDKNGNITSLKRYNNPTLVDDLSYTYSGSNKLAAVADAVATTSGVDWDAEDATYSYDLDGNMTGDTHKFDRISYGSKNLPVGMRVNGLLEALYRYNSSGWRISKEVVNTVTQTTTEEEYYIMDGGVVLAVTDATGTIKHWNLYGIGLIGRQATNGDQRFYVYDHLGSTRQVVDDNNVIKETYDYYPFGALIRASFDEGTKEGFTGKELDEESGLHYFGARYYDAALGRWSVLDPADQGFSPYMFSGNNPVIFIDSDGNFWHIVIGAVVGGAVNLGTKIYQGKVDSFWDGVAAFGIGAAAGGVAAATGGASFLAAGGGAAGAGGFAAGAFSGVYGYLASTPIQSIGNTLYFQDPLPTTQDILVGAGTSLLTGGIINGGAAVVNGRGFLRGNVISQNSNLTTATTTTTTSITREVPDHTLSPTEIGPARDISKYGNGFQNNSSNIIQRVDFVEDARMLSFTKSNFRENLIRAYNGGVNPGSNIHAHHVLPQEFAKEFATAGINVHNPRYGVFLERSVHLAPHSRYNAEWGRFFIDNVDKLSPSFKNEIFQHAKTLMQKYYGM
ncbi:MAG: RHS repeat-associated core domain-containing protein [Balneolaceae bacterium]